MTERTTPWWAPAHFSAKRPVLEQRASILRAVRDYFVHLGFTEVETPILQISGGMEPHLKLLETVLSEPFVDQGRRMQLHTSPEFAMKKLLAAGMERIFQIARVFRDGERSDTHSPEFTMLEWYRADAGLDELMRDCEGLVRALPVWRAGADIDRPFERLSVAQAFERYADIDLLACLGDGEDLDPDPAPLAAAARGIGLFVTDSDRFEDVMFRVLLDRIEPRLGFERPTFLHGYPACMAALARRDPADPRLALRFELYVDGIELANAFAELTDPAEQRARFEHDAALKTRLYGADAVIDEDFLAALEHMPDATGIALGLDRLVMLATGAKTIDEVLWAPVGQGPG